MMTIVVLMVSLVLLLGVLAVDAFQVRTVTTSRRIRPLSTITNTTQLYMHNNNNNNNNNKNNSKKKKSPTTTNNNKGFGSLSSSSTKIVIDKFPYSGSVRPGTIIPQRVVSDPTIVKPDYWKTGEPIHTGRISPFAIEIKTTDQIQRMKEAGALARIILDGAGRLVQDRITTDEIDQWVHNEIIKNKAYPSPLNYHGFPKSCCTSVNEVICHGIPDDRKLNKGEIINLDITVYYNGYHGDCSEMFVVGDETDIPLETRQLLQTTYDCWISACSIVKPGVDYKEIGTVIENYITPRGYRTVKQFCGHGIGSAFHPYPDILHYKNNEKYGSMVAGHTFTIEPMICQGLAKTLLWPDEWTATTVDGKLSAQFEHTLLVTPDGGVEALTGKNMNSPIQFWERDSTIHKGIWLGTSKSAQKIMQEINAVRFLQNENAN